MGSSWTRDQTVVPCIGRQILYHCATGRPHLNHFKVCNIEVLTMCTLCNSSLDPFCLAKLKVSPIEQQLLFASLPLAPGNHHSTFWFEEFDLLRYLM